MPICKINIAMPQDPLSASVVRPPGAMPPGTFEARCHRCRDCIEVCPSDALAVDASGYPCLAEAPACWKCGLFSDVCTRGAIGFTARTRAGLRMVKAMEARSNRW